LLARVESEVVCKLELEERRRIKLETPKPLKKKKTPKAGSAGENFNSRAILTSAMV
jgi:hypothetical protein